KFVGGTKAAVWKTVADYLSSDAPAAIMASPSQLQQAERCWQLLIDPEFDKGIISFYNPGGWRDEYDAMAGRLARNARGLFATALTAATARQRTAYTISVD